MRLEEVGLGPLIWQQLWLIRRLNGKTLSPLRFAQVPVKNGKPAAATPKQKKEKLPQTPSKPNLNDLKKKLLASPSLPKKYEKFVNLMKNAHKVTDEKEIKNTWEFVQKNKK